MAVALMMAGTLLLLAAAGVSDPKPLGQLAAREDDVTVTADHGMALHPAPAAIQPPGTIRATLALSRGTDMSAVGLAWGNEENQTAVLVTINGHLGIYAFEGETESAIRPFERFPHVMAGDNTLQVDFTETEAVIWLNEEYVATLPREAGEPIKAGIMLWAPGDVGEMEVRQLEVWE